MKKTFFIFLMSFLSISLAQAQKISTEIFSTDGSKQLLGQLYFTETPYGLLISPKLTGLPPGLHGLHLHQHPDCSGHGMDAGDHFDPKNTNSHQGPYGQGHLGDLPVLYVDQNGKANTPILAPRLRLNDLKSLAIMIHAGGDSYSDTPKLGGGGDRIGCGVLP